MAAIMYTDMVGYTALGQRNETLSLALVEEQRKLIRPILARHNGREVKTMGDAFLVEFPSALDAVRCAYDIQRATREFNIPMPEDRRVHLRVGIHLGDVVESNDDISGDAVNVASRIEPFAEEGGVCLTRQVYDHIQNKFELPLASLGTKALKNVNLPIEVFRMEMPWEVRKASRPALLDKKRIAVLPFANTSPDPNDEYFADGMTEELISAISNVSGLSVISHTSVKQYKKPSEKLIEIGEDLGVGTILEGSVRKFGNRVRVAVQLIEVVEDTHLWAQNYDRELEDVFAIQSDIAERVAKALEVKLLGEERQRLGGRASKNAEALILYMKGKSSYNEGNESGVRKAIEYFQHTIQQDPDFSLAYVGLADCFYFLEGSYMSHTEGIAKAKENLDKALALNPDLGEAHAVLGHWLTFELRWEHAESEFRKALELSPSDADTHDRYAGLLMYVGRLDEALYEARKAQELNPISPRCGWRIGQALYYRREYDLAVEQFNQVLRMEPNYPSALLWLAFVYLSKSKTEEALELVLKWRELEGDYPFSPGFTKGMVAYFYAHAGRKEEAKTMFKQAAESDPGLTPMAFAHFNISLGNIDLAFEFLEKAYEAKDPLHYDTKVFPLLDPIRSDPRYAVLLQKLHL